MRSEDIFLKSSRRRHSCLKTKELISQVALDILSSDLIK